MGWSGLQVLDKCHWATQILLRFSPFKTSVDNLLPALNGLVLGRMTKPECQTLGAAAVRLQEICYEAVEAYFAIPMPEHFLGDSVQSFLRTFLEDVHILEDFCILTIKTRTRRGTLHLACSVDSRTLFAAGRSLVPCQEISIPFLERFAEPSSTP